MTPFEFRKIRRERLGLTQEQLAVRLGTTRMTITRYEAGTRRISGVAQTALKQVAQYRCLYKARLTYSATLVTRPVPNPAAPTGGT